MMEEVIIRYIDFTELAFLKEYGVLILFHCHFVLVLSS